MHVVEVCHTTETAHRIPNHEDGEGKCARLHGHSYRYDVKVASSVLDENGFVIDFSEIKRALDEWDHRLLLWEDDPLVVGDSFGVIRLPFVPTAEHMAQHLAERFAAYENVLYADVSIHETAKTTASYYVNAARRARHALSPLAREVT